MERCQDGPKILDRRVTPVSPWVSLVEKDVCFARDRVPETYHCLAQADYVSVVAQTVDGGVPLVRQYRPAVEDFTWELPSGLLEPGEAPEECARRELREEAGMQTEAMRSLGSYLPDTGRLGNRIHVFSARVRGPAPDFRPEEGVEPRVFSVEELKRLIREGEFRHQLHLGVLLLAGLERFQLERWR